MPPTTTAVPGTRATGAPAPLLVLAAIASVQFGSAIAKGLFDELGPAGVTLLRVGLAGLVLTAVLRPSVRAWGREQWTSAVLLGLAMGAMNLTFYFSIQTVPLGVAVTVEFVGPLLLALVQTRRVLDAVWALLAFSGVALLGLDAERAAPLSGLLLALLAGFFWAGYILASARVGRALPGLDGLGVALLVSALLALPFGGAGALVAFTDLRLLAGAALVALLSSLLPYAFEMVALRTMPTRVFGVLMALEPAAAAVAGLLVLSQLLGTREVVALALVSVASLGVTLGRRPQDPVPQPLE